MSEALTSTLSILAIVVSLGTLIVNEMIRRIAALQQRRGPELCIRFESDPRSAMRLLLIENLGDSALDMNVSVYLDPEGDDRYPRGESSPFWVLRRRVYPGRPQRWAHSLAAVLSEMGYRGDCTFLLRFVGRYWPTAAGEKHACEHTQVYLVDPREEGWLFIEQSDDDWYYADEQRRGTLLREGIPKGLRRNAEQPQ